MAAELIHDQYQELGRVLSGTKSNVTKLVNSMFGYNWKDSDFDVLTIVAGIFRCVKCNEWKDEDEEDPQSDGICGECLMN